MKLKKVKILREAFKRRINRHKDSLITFELELDNATDVNYIHDLKANIRVVEYDLLAFEHYHKWMEQYPGEEVLQKKIDEMIVNMENINKEMNKL